MDANLKTLWLSKRRLETLLSVLDQAPPMDAMTLLLPPGASPDAHCPTNERQAQWLKEMRETAPDRLWQSETGLAFYWSEQLGLAVEPPFPLESASLRNCISLAPLQTLLHREPLMAVALLRLGSYSVGVFRGRRLLDAKTGTRYVKGRHSAGGTSQRRFARVREKQIHYLYVKVCEVVSQKLGPYENQLERVFLGGERHTLSGFVKQCPFLQRLEPLISSRILSVREPRRRELERMPNEIWKSRVSVFRLPDGFPFDGL